MGTSDRGNSRIYTLIYTLIYILTNIKMEIDKKELFNYLDNYIFETQTELKGEINQRICMKNKTKYYTERKITDRLYNEYLDYKTK